MIQSPNSQARHIPTRSLPTPLQTSSLSNRKTRKSSIAKPRILGTKNSINTLQWKGTIKWAVSWAKRLKTKLMSISTITTNSESQKLKYRAKHSSPIPLTTPSLDWSRKESILSAWMLWKPWQITLQTFPRYRARQLQYKTSARLPKQASTRSTTGSATSKKNWNITIAMLSSNRSSKAHMQIGIEIWARKARVGPVHNTTQAWKKSIGSTTMAINKETATVLSIP